MLNGIPKSRLILYVLLLGLLPVLFVAFHFWQEKSALDRMELQIESLANRAITKQSKQTLNSAVRAKYRNADHFYLDKYLESLTFLEPEIESLKLLMENKHFAGDEKVTKRLEKLTGKENRLLFTGGQVITYPTFQETSHSLLNPVELNLDDLQQILAKIEGIQIRDYAPGKQRPQLIITDFKLDKKTVSGSNQVYILNLKLLKREYL